jgi:hypothetical protein
LTQLPPRIEARISAQERRQINIEARLEELSEDMIASFKQQLAEQAQFEQKVDARFDTIETKIATMAMKEDIAGLEKRMLDASQQLVAVIETRLPGQKGE